MELSGGFGEWVDSPVSNGFHVSGHLWVKVVSYILLTKVAFLYLVVTLYHNACEHCKASFRRIAGAGATPVSGSGLAAGAAPMSSDGNCSPSSPHQPRWASAHSNADKLLFPDPPPMHMA
jgi:hypothetical protein